MHDALGLFDPPKSTVGKPIEVSTLLYLLQQLVLGKFGEVDAWMRKGFRHCSR
jgi:hypothetical protein